jgi:WD40 repeat protein
VTCIKLTRRACLLTLMFALGTIFLTITPSTFAQEDFFTFTELLEDDVDGADGLRSVNATAVSPDGKHLYVVSTGDFSIALYKRNITSGNISFVEMWRDRVGDVEGLDDPYHIVISPDGAHVYVGAYDGKTVSVFDRNSTTGSLSFKQVFDLGGARLWACQLFGIEPRRKGPFCCF